MTKRFGSTTAVLAAVTLLGGCGPIGDKQTDIATIYGITAFIALALLLCYCFTVKKKSLWFIMLFSAISVVNVGYFALSLSTTVEEALLANRIAYLGSVFLPLFILMMIADLCHFNISKWLPTLLMVLAWQCSLLPPAPVIRISTTKTPALR